MFVDQVMFINAKTDRNVIKQRTAKTYLRRLRAVGVTEAVGDEEDRDRGEEPALIVIREVEDAPSGADMSLLSSSLLLRDTGQTEEMIFEYLLFHECIRLLLQYQ